MTDYSKFRRKYPRVEATVIFQCFADHRMFVREFALMPHDMQDAFNRGLNIPCEGSGVVGPWCESCEFGEYKND